jgi:hypothetical protein
MFTTTPIRGLAALATLSLVAFASAGEPSPQRAAPRGVAPTSSRAPTLAAKTQKAGAKAAVKKAAVRLRRAPRAARDPFAPPPALRGRALPAATTRGAPVGAGDPLGGLEIRALIVLRGGRSGAILAQAGRRWLVRPGDSFPAGGLSAEVRKIDRQGVELQLRDAAGSSFGPTRRVRQ